MKRNENLKYTKVPFTDDEKEILKARAKAQGKRLNAYIRDVLLKGTPTELSFDQKVIEEHTKALNSLREEFNKIYFADMDDKILMSPLFKNIQESLVRLEHGEAKFRRDIRHICIMMKGEELDEIEVGGDNDIS